MQKVVGRDGFGFAVFSGFHRWSQDGGAVSGEGAGCGLGQVFGFPVHAD